MMTVKTELSTYGLVILLTQKKKNSSNLILSLWSLQVEDPVAINNRTFCDMNVTNI